MLMEQKFIEFKNYLIKLGKVAVAFSGGVDSTFLLKTAHDLLGDNAIAITARSNTFPRSELNEAIEFCDQEGIRQIIFEFNEMEIEGFAQNPPERCYLCKKALFRQLLNLAKDNSIPHVLDGSNADDVNDFRPGLKALSELDIKSPLKYADLTKSEIRELSKRLNLNTWDKPSIACLATRIPYGDTITEEKLSMIDQAEEFLKKHGLRQLRVRCHENLARIETDRDGFEIIMNIDLREEINDKFRQLGFTYSAIDLIGYRMGSMNEQAKDSKQ